jgi:hypothetical protein
MTWSTYKRGSRTELRVQERWNALSSSSGDGLVTSKLCDDEVDYAIEPYCEEHGNAAS